MGIILPQRKPKIGDRGGPRKADTVDMRHGQSAVDRRCQVILERRHPKQENLFLRHHVGRTIDIPGGWAALTHYKSTRPLRNT